ncbi:hypothetical protein [Armatimonas sp.]|uniref:NYN domain-containing protein n=1 Tax=Armatimonas sp. TaxID=1872638 RepID=UPI0037535D2B
MTTDEWREKLAALPSKEIHRLLKNEPDVTAKISTGFRPGAETLKNPIVLKRLAEALPNNPKLAEALEGLEPTPAPLAPRSADLSLPLPQRPEGTQVAASGAGGRVGSDEKLHMKLKELRAALKDKDTQLAQQAVRLAQLEKEHAATLAERDSERLAREAVAAKLERERRRKAPDPVPVAPSRSAPPLTVARALGAPQGEQAGWVPEALTRLLLRGHDVTVLALSHELLTDETLPVAARAGIQGVYAFTLESLGAPEAPEQCRAATDAFLSAGQLLEAGEALRRSLTKNTPSAAERALLQRLLALAERRGELETLGQWVASQRNTHPSAFACLGKALESAGKKYAGLLPTASKAKLAPDAMVALPTSAKSVASVTARQLVTAVDAGDGARITKARAGIAALRTGNPSLAEALLEAIGALSAPALITLTALRLRPVIVDASNVARHIADPLAALVAKKQTASLAQLLQLREFLLSHGFFPVLCIADANLRHLVSEKALYVSLVERHIIRETLPGTSADELLLTEAHAHNAPLITNDRLADWGKQAEGIERLGFTVHKNGICLLPS